MRIFQVDTFTRTPFSGNPATVVLDAHDSDDALLTHIAREFSRGDIAFVDAAQTADTAPASDHAVSLRFFNSHKEVPFVGHATLAAHAVLLSLGRRDVGVCRQRSGTGIIEVWADRDASPRFKFRQTLPEFGAPLPLKTTLRVAEALRLPATQLHEIMPACIARKGGTRLLVPVARPAVLDMLQPNHQTLLALGSELGADGFCVFASSRDPALTVTSRMFCPALGIAEDPVSGNAHAMLAAYLWDAGQLNRDTPRFTGFQGKHVDRPGEVHVELETKHGELIAVHVGGDAVIVSEGVLKLP